MTQKKEKYTINQEKKLVLYLNLNQVCSPDSSFLKFFLTFFTIFQLFLLYFDWKIMLEMFTTFTLRLWEERSQVTCPSITWRSPGLGVHSLRADQCTNVHACMLWDTRVMHAETQKASTSITCFHTERKDKRIIFIDSLQKNYLRRFTQKNYLRMNWSLSLKWETYKFPSSTSMKPRDSPYSIFKGKAGVNLIAFTCFSASCSVVVLWRTLSDNPEVKTKSFQETMLH